MVGACVVAFVALVVQQPDHGLLAPGVYGRALQMHPLIILFAVVSGGALFGMAGTVLAVPVTAVALNVVAEARREVPVLCPQWPMVGAVGSPPPPAPVTPRSRPQSSGRAVLATTGLSRILRQ